MILVSIHLKMVMFVNLSKVECGDSGSVLYLTQFRQIRPQLVWRINYWYYDSSLICWIQKYTDYRKYRSFRWAFLRILWGTLWLGRVSFPNVGGSAFTIAMGRIITSLGLWPYGQHFCIAKRYYALYMSYVDCEHKTRICQHSHLLCNNLI